MSYDMNPADEDMHLECAREIMELKRLLLEKERQLNAVITSCYYRTKSGHVHWKQGMYFGTSVLKDTEPGAFLQAMQSIRRNAGIPDDDSAGEGEAGPEDPAESSFTAHDWCANAQCRVCSERFSMEKGNA